MGSGLFTSSKGKDHNSVKRVTKRRRVQEFRQRRIGITPPLCLEMNQTVCRLPRHVTGWRPPAAASRASLKLQIAAADGQTLTRARVSLLRGPEVQSVALIARSRRRPAEPESQLVSFRATSLFNKVFRSIVNRQRHLGYNAAGQWCK